MDEAITYVGIDAHKKDLAIAMLVGTARIPTIWTVANEPRAVERLRRKLSRIAAGPIECCYEAGPCGYALYRQLHRGRLRCQVIAPALIPRKPGERIKTDRRDARKLAELHRAGLLTEVRPPTPAEEAVRDLARARDDARDDLQRARQRLVKLLLRRGLHYAGKKLDARTPGVGPSSVLGARGGAARGRRLPAWRLITLMPASANWMPGWPSSRRPRRIGRRSGRCAASTGSTP